MFIDCSELIKNNTPFKSNGIAVADIDGDGFFEILVSGFGCANRIFKWQNNKLDALHLPSLEDPIAESISICAADIDRDGREEIYIVNNDSKDPNNLVGDRLFAWFGDRWVDLFQNDENIDMLNLASGRSVGCIDRFGDGKYGFVVANHSIPWRLYELDRKGHIVDCADDAGLDIVAPGKSLICAQLIKNHMDIFATVKGGPNLLLQNNGEGAFEDSARRFKINDISQGSAGATLFDMNQDGMPDILYGDRTGKNRIYIQQLNSSFEEFIPEVFEHKYPISNIIVADFDNDGKEEIFFHNLGEANKLFKRKGEKWVEVDIGDAADPDGDARGAIIADIDGDGALELILSRGYKTPQPLKLFKAASHHRHWLRVCPLTINGAPARGAIVKIEVNKNKLLRSICSGSGYLCQNEPVAHFGLGASNCVDKIEIRWPDGATETFKNVPADQMLTVAHPDSSTGRMQIKNC